MSRCCNLQYYPTMHICTVLGVCVCVCVYLCVCVDTCVLLFVPNVSHFTLMIHTDFFLRMYVCVRLCE